MNDTINYYELLGVKNNATEEEIKTAYKQMIKKWHPDINKDENASTISIQLNEAKTILLDPVKRSEYDDLLLHKDDKNYQNMRNRATRTNTETTQNKQDEKYYTKWEYYKEYMKYYNKPYIFKIIISILILLETILCGLLQVINYIFAQLFCYIVELTYDYLLYIVGFFAVLIVSTIYGNDMVSVNDYLLPSLFGLILFIIVFLPEKVVYLLTYNIPVLLSKLNIYLFKKCVGYKN